MPLYGPEPLRARMTPPGPSPSARYRCADRRKRPVEQPTGCNAQEVRPTWRLRRTPASMTPFDRP
jgi:hypothetical protein